MNGATGPTPIAVPPAYNNFKSTTIRGNFNNKDYTDGSIIANAIFDGDLSVKGSLFLGDQTYIIDNLTGETTNIDLNEVLNIPTIQQQITDIQLNPGSTGPQGNQGVKGDTGPQGPSGLNGIYGDQGDKGDTGPQGDIGETGPQGPQGNQGFTGPQGSQGNQGFTGPQGPQGNRGFTGPQGSQGNQGFTGPQGPQGNQGFTGPQGPQGNQGFTGPQGSQGTNGSPWSGGTFSGDITTSSNIYLTGTIDTTQTSESTRIDFRNGNSKIYDNYHLNIVTDDLMYIKAPTSLNIISPTCNLNGDLEITGTYVKAPKFTLGTSDLQGLLDAKANVPFKATIKLLLSYHFYWGSMDYGNEFEGDIYAFYYTANSGFFTPPFVNNSNGMARYTYNITSQAEIYYDQNGLLLYFPNPSDKNFIVHVNGVYRNDTQTSNQGLFFQVNNRGNGTILNGVRHSYFYLRWSMAGTSTFIDSRTTDPIHANTGYTKTGLIINSGQIDVTVTLI